MSLDAAFLLPHPPIMIPEVGGKNIEKVKDTIDNVKYLSHILKKENYELYILISPHLPLKDKFIIYSGTVSGNLEIFNVPEIKITVSSNAKYCSSIKDQADNNQIETEVIDIDEKENFLDHGCIVPLWSLFGGERIECIPIGLTAYSHFNNHTNYNLGKIISDTVDTLNKKTALLISGDLSHRLKPGGSPAGYSPRGLEFDYRIGEIFKSGRLNDFIKIDKMLTDEAGHCGLPGLQIMAGAINNKELEARVHSYEGPFGVGYMVASVIVK